MHDRRRENRALTVSLMVRFLYQHHLAWYTAYMDRHRQTAMQVI